MPVSAPEAHLWGILARLLWGYPLTNLYQILSCNLYSHLRLQIRLQIRLQNSLVNYQQPLDNTTETLTTMFKFTEGLVNLSAYLNSNTGVVCYSTLFRTRVTTDARTSPLVTLSLCLYVRVVLTAVAVNTARSTVGNAAFSTALNSLQLKLYFILTP